MKPLYFVCVFIHTCTHVTLVCIWFVMPGYVIQACMPGHDVKMYFLSWIVVKQKNADLWVSPTPIWNHCDSLPFSMWLVFLKFLLIFPDGVPMSTFPASITLCRAARGLSKAWDNHLLFGLNSFLFSKRLNYKLLSWSCPFYILQVHTHTPVPPLMPSHTVCHSLNSPPFLTPVCLSDYAFFA